MQVNLSPEAYENLKAFRKEVFEKTRVACTYSQLIMKLLRDRL